MANKVVFETGPDPNAQHVPLQPWQKQFVANQPGGSDTESGLSALAQYYGNTQRGLLNPEISPYYTGNLIIGGKKGVTPVDRPEYWTPLLRTRALLTDAVQAQGSAPIRGAYSPAVRQQLASLSKGDPLGATLLANRQPQYDRQALLQRLVRMAQMREQLRGIYESGPKIAATQHQLADQLQLQRKQEADKTSADILKLAFGAVGAFTGGGLGTGLSNSFSNALGQQTS